MPDATAELILDLREVRLCDAASMATLVEVGHACRARGGRLRLAAPDGLVARAFAVVAFGGIVSISATVADAAAGDETQRIKD